MYIYIHIIAPYVCTPSNGEHFTRSLSNKVFGRKGGFPTQICINVKILIYISVDCQERVRRPQPLFHLLFPPADSGDTWTNKLAVTFCVPNASCPIGGFSETATSPLVRSK